MLFIPYLELLQYAFQSGGERREWMVYKLREHRLRVFYMYVRRRFFSLRIAIFNKILEMTSIELQK